MSLPQPQPLNLKSIRSASPRKSISGNTLNNDQQTKTPVLTVPSVSPSQDASVAVPGAGSPVVVAVSVKSTGDESVGLSSLSASSATNSSSAPVTAAVSLVVESSEHQPVNANEYDRTMMVFFGIVIVWIMCLYYLAKDNLDWYDNLNNIPTWSKNNKLIVFLGGFSMILLAYSLYLAYVKQENKNNRVGMSVCFGSVIVLSLIWYAIFFRQQNPYHAFHVSLVLLVSVFVLVYYLWISNQNAFYLSLPFVVWCLVEVYIGYNVMYEQTRQDVDDLTTFGLSSGVVSP